MSANDDTSPTVPAGAGEETSGDYSYDMAHDVPTAATPHPEAAPHKLGAADVHPPDQGGDYSYDLAHEVPRSGQGQAGL